MIHERYLSQTIAKICRGKSDRFPCMSLGETLAKIKLKGEKLPMVVITTTKEYASIYNARSTPKKI